MFEVRHGHLVGKLQGEGREDLLGPELNRDQINDAPDLGMCRNGRPQRCDNLCAGGLSHQHLFVFTRQHGRNSSEQNTDCDRCCPIPDRIFRHHRKRRSRHCDDNPDQCRRVLKHERERGRVLAALDRLPDALLAFYAAKGPPSDPKRDRLEDKGQPEDDEGDPGSRDRRGVEDVKGTFIDRNARPR
jgi:hypothetical protein